MTVITWQPIASAWTTLSSSRGLAQISSSCGYGFSTSSASLMIGIGSRPESAMRPAKTETNPPGPCDEPGGRILDLVERHQRGDVHLHAARPRVRRTTSADGSARVVVIGTLT